MSSSVDMSLSDIIKNKRTNNKSSTGGIKKRGSFKRTSTGSSSAPRRQSGGIRKPAFQPNVVVSNDKRIVRVNISNLAPSVISSDLQELFGEFNLRSVGVNFNENGVQLGTGDVTLSKRDGDRLIQKYAGVALDSHALKFAMIDSNIASRTVFPKAQNTAANRRTSHGRNDARKGAKPSNGKGAKASTPSKKAGAAKKKRDEKPKKTTEELDAELDAYMSRGGSNDVEME